MNCPSTDTTANIQRNDCISSNNRPSVGSTGALSHMETYGGTMGRRNSITSTRIPLALQSVFIFSNRGMEVNTPPPRNVANSTFFKTKSFFSSKNKSKIKIYNQKSLPSVEAKSKDKNAVDQPKSTLSYHTPIVLAPHLVDLPELYDSSAREIPQPGILKRHESKLKLVSSPQQYLDDIMYSRGYSTMTSKTLQSGYFSSPTKLQKASYNIYLLNLALSIGDGVDPKNKSKISELEKILSCGISCNPCNAHGESLLHRVCRAGSTKALKVLLKAGATVQICDDYGRTPLHDVCWRSEPNFEMLQMIATKDIYLFHMSDIRGATPLSYVHKKQWNAYIEFIDEKKDIWWDPKYHSDDSYNFSIPELVKEKPNFRIIPESENALTPVLANMVTSNKISPEEASYLNICGDGFHDIVCSDYYSSDDEDDSSNESDYYSSDEEDELSIESDYYSSDEEDELSNESTTFNEI